jgi:hypothetical protein
MNEYEVITLLLAELSLIVYLRRQFKSWRAALLLATLAAAPLYLSLERASQFLTTDETQIIRESLYLGSSNLRQWALGAARTTDTMLGLVATLLRSLFPGLTEVSGKIILKNVHWMTGFGVLLWMHYLVSKHLVSESNRRLFFVAFMYAAFLLPTNSLCLKILESMHN